MEQFPKMPRSARSSTPGVRSVVVVIALLLVSLSVFSVRANASTCEDVFASTLSETSRPAELTVRVASQQAIEILKQPFHSLKGLFRVLNFSPRLETRTRRMVVDVFRYAFELEAFNGNQQRNLQFAERLASREGISEPEMIDLSQRVVQRLEGMRVLLAGSRELPPELQAITRQLDRVYVSKVFEAFYLDSPTALLAVRSSSRMLGLEFHWILRRRYLPPNREFIDPKLARLALGGTALGGVVAGVTGDLNILSMMGGITVMMYCENAAAFLHRTYIRATSFRGDLQITRSINQRLGSLGVSMTQHGVHQRPTNSVRQMLDQATVHLNELEQRALAGPSQINSELLDLMSPIANTFSERLIREAFAPFSPVTDSPRIISSLLELKRQRSSQVSLELRDRMKLLEEVRAIHARIEDVVSIQDFLTRYSVVLHRIATVSADSYVLEQRSFATFANATATNVTRILDTKQREILNLVRLDESQRLSELTIQQLESILE